MCCTPSKQKGEKHNLISLTYLTEEGARAANSSRLHVNVNKGIGIEEGQSDGSEITSLEFPRRRPNALKRERVHTRHGDKKKKEKGSAAHNKR